MSQMNNEDTDTSVPARTPRHAPRERTRLRCNSSLARRKMKLQVNIKDGDVMVSVDESVLYLTPATWKRAG